MKKTILAISAVSILMFGCNCNNSKKESSEEQGTVTPTQVETSEQESPDSVTASDEIPYLYKAEDGSIMEVQFSEDPKRVEVKFNGKDYSLDQTTAWAKGAEYEKDGFLFTYKQENASVKVDGKTIDYVLISPLTYQYTNGDETIFVTYFSKNNDDDKRYVTINKDGEDITLEQTEAWAKGAIYGDGDTVWTDSFDKDAVLTQEGKKITYKKAK